MLDEVKDTSIMTEVPEKLSESVEEKEAVEVITETVDTDNLEKIESEKSEEPELAESITGIVNENSKIEDASAAAEISSLLSTEPYSHLTEDELEIEFEQELLPGIEKGVYPDGCVEKLIRMGELCEVDIIHIEAAYYLRYYYYMIAKYVLEQKYNASKDPNDLARLEAFEDKYNSAKEEYQEVRDNSLPLELRLINNFVEAASPLIQLSYTKIFSEITLSLDTDKNLPEEFNLFFFPESDFYGIINSIKINTAKRPRTLNDYKKGSKNKAEYVRFDDKHMRFFDLNYKSKIDFGILVATRDIIDIEIS